LAGLPGTGKSTLAEHAARVLRCPLFTKDRLETTLRRSGIEPENNSGWAAYELLTTLADEQLRLGQSAVLDSTATFERVRGNYDAWSDDRLVLDAVDPVDRNVAALERYLTG
jgi:predicted kinase